MMAVKSNIEWTDSTWNPIRGCTPISPGCKNCYASSVAKRFSGPGLPYEGLVRINAKGEHTDEWNGTIKFVEKHLMDPLKWKEPRKIFVNSMSDLFHENVTDEMRNLIFAVMALCPQHTFQILTKRPERIVEYFGRLKTAADSWAAKIGKSFTPSDLLNLNWMHWRVNHGPAFPYGPWPLPNVWLGTSAENQECFDKRMPHLDAVARQGWTTFLSLEPLLGPIDVQYPVSVYPKGAPMCCTGVGGYHIECGCQGMPTEPPMFYSVKQVIVGAESGHGHRPMEEEWVRDIQRACAYWKIAFFYKQKIVNGKKVGLPALDGKIYHEFPEVPS
jgi:protein gp37